MTDTLEIFGTEYTNVAGFKATDDNSQTKTYIRPQGTKSISANGTGIDVTEYAAVDVAVPTGTARTSEDVTVSGDTVSVPAGLYASAVSKSVASGTEGTPTATKGTVSDHSVSVTPSVTNNAGYIPGGTHTGTAVTVTAAELESGTKSITANGTNIDVTGYAAVDVNVSGGGSSYTLLHSEEVAVSTTSTTTTNVKTIQLNTGWTADDIIYIRIRDKAGKRNGYFYGSDNFVINAYAKNGSTSIYQNVLKYSWAYSNSVYTVNAQASTIPYGVAVSQVSLNELSGISITVVKRYNSTSSKTVNGTFTIEVYKIAPPTGKPFFT